VKPVVKLENVLLLYLTRSGSVNSPKQNTYATISCTCNVPRTIVSSS
jgi:hypothetical protein